MGFAGQLFAARVAIGLAIPSPQALSKAGQQLATGIAGMMNAIDRAKERRGMGAGLKKEFANIASTSKSALDEMNAHIVIKTKESQKQIAKLAGTGADSIQANFKKNMKAMENLKSVTGRAGKRIFGGGALAGEDGDHGQFMLNIQKNLGGTIDSLLHKNQNLVQLYQEQKDAVMEKIEKVIDITPFSKGLYTAVIKVRDKIIKIDKIILE